MEVREHITRRHIWAALAFGVYSAFMGSNNIWTMLGGLVGGFVGTLLFIAAVIVAAKGVIRGLEQARSAIGGHD